MKNKTQNTEKKTLKKQLISGGVYIALSAVAVAVTVNTAVSMLSDNPSLESIEETVEKTKAELPSVPETLVFPSVDVPFYNNESPLTEGIPVTDSPSGISAEILPEIVTETDNSDSLITAEQENIIDIPEISSNANLGDDTFIKPCDGFVTVEHSIDIPVYSSTLGDYRTHTGVDIAVDNNAVVKAVKGGVITKIYTHDLNGHSLQLETPDGCTFIYSNLSLPLSEGIEEGLAVSTGTVLGGVGTSAIAESSQESHLHFEMYKDGSCVNPCDFIDF